ncbi:hypothetical protein CERZMDRAFT_83944 [Cercospora zeae-maydis SCOH1-5]|uniref:J domain-containing protein n=1 Tax=Cercospora zeae-maydis SCOH1-5 TaxID=717836 RepID=A0A6A6FHX9_9PEZI|nr:hypothetical protein CERZMDRAFT_83944 [Cercospora zeae-maydis SCOH1-5]
MASDLKDYAVNSAHDYYELLGISPVAAEADIRRAGRKTALKYHPDKVGKDPIAAEKFHLLQVALEVLCDEGLRQLYDNARRARETKKARDQAYEGRRKNLKEELERREREGVTGLKRKHDEDAEEEAFQREFKRLAADGARRRKEREERLWKEAQEEFEREKVQSRPTTPAASTAVPQEIDRTIKFRYLANAANAPSKEELTTRWSKFGEIQDVVSVTKKIKVEGEKHRKEYTTAIVVYKSIVAAHAAVTDFPDLAKDEAWQIYENVNWAGGQEPDCIPKPKKPATALAGPDVTTPLKAPTAPGLDRPRNNGPEEGASRKVPSFSSFKGTPKASGVKTGSAGGLSSAEATMIRIKNAERRRLAEELRKAEEAQDQVD